MADQPAASSSSGSVPKQTVAQKKAERMKKLRELHGKRVRPSDFRNKEFVLTMFSFDQTEASKLNHQEVVEEYKRNKLPSNWEKKREWAEYKINEEEKKDQAVAEGVDYDRVKLLEVQADDAERWERKKKAKKNADPGFSGYDAATARQYTRCTKALKPDFEEYQRTKEEMGDEAFYAGRDTIIQGLRKDPKQAVDRMVEDLNKQIEKRDKYSRRRRFDADADVDYINERNMKFNKKLERFYGNYTTEIKQNLERGTAV